VAATFLVKAEFCGWLIERRGEYYIRGRSSAFSRLGATLCVGCPCLLDRRLSLLLPERRLGLAMPLIGCSGNSLCSSSDRLLTLCLCMQHTCEAFLLVVHAGKVGQMLQVPGGQAGQAAVEA
jgi:hypothetical protein